MLCVKELKDCEELLLRNSHKQFKSLWVKMKDSISEGHLVAGVYHVLLPDHSDSVDKTSCFKYRNHCACRLSS